MKKQFPQSSRRPQQLRDCQHISLSRRSLFAIRLIVGPGRGTWGFAPAVTKVRGTFWFRVMVQDQVFRDGLCVGSLSAA